MDRADSQPGGDVAPAALAPAAKGKKRPKLPPGLWAKLKHLIVHNILHLDDTPHRIAFGVFLGFFIGATPTIGFQMIIYVAVAAVLRANKISGILPVWISNPLTAVPLYYTNWAVGRFLLTGEVRTSESAKAAIAAVVEGVPGLEQTFWERIISAEFWSAAFTAFVEMGVELWVGSALVGTILGALGYWVTYRSVIAFRRKRAARQRRASSVSKGPSSQTG